MAQGSSDEMENAIEVIFHRHRSENTHKINNNNNFHNLQCLVDMLASSSPSGFTTGFTLVFPAHFLMMLS